MTKLLQSAIEKMRVLPESEQDEIAELVLAEIESEQKWTDLFANSSDELQKLGDRALAQHEAGETEVLDPDKL